MHNLLHACHLPAADSSVLLPLSFSDTAASVKTIRQPHTCLSCCTPTTCPYFLHRCLLETLLCNILQLPGHCHHSFLCLSAPNSSDSCKVGTPIPGRPRRQLSSTFYPFATPRVVSHSCGLTSSLYHPLHSISSICRWIDECNRAYSPRFRTSTTPTSSKMHPYASISRITPHIFFDSSTQLPSAVFIRSNLTHSLSSINN